MVMFHKLGLINKNQRGFTLVEILVAILISALISMGITAAVFQLFIGSERNSSHMTAVRQVESAGYWISHDAQMAQEADTASGSLLSLTWTHWNEETTNLDMYKVVYNLADNELRRSYYLNNEIPKQVTIIARFIDSASCDPSDFGLVFTVTAVVQEQTETREYQIIPRPG